MNVTVTTTGLTGPRTAEAMMHAMRKAARTVGEVYVAGARNQNLAAIHEGGAILKSGASTAVKRPTRGKNAGKAKRGTHSGYIPARNFLFVQRSALKLILGWIREGANAVLHSADPAPFDAVMLRAATEAAESMRRNVLGGKGAVGQQGERLGLAEAPGVRVGTGAKMVPLKPATLARKRHFFGSQPALVATGQMVDSVRARVVKEGA